MVSERLIALFAFGILITFLAQTKSVEATRRVVIPVGPRIVQCMKKVEELKKEIASLEKSKRKKQLILLYCFLQLNILGTKVVYLCLFLNVQQNLLHVLRL